MCWTSFTKKQIIYSPYTIYKDDTIQALKNKIIHAYNRNKKVCWTLVGLLLVLAAVAAVTEMYEMKKKITGFGGIRGVAG